jgi:hypothetical protein
MTDHTNLAAKIAIRIYFRDKLKESSNIPIKILECYAGEKRDIYKNCYLGDDVTSLDKKGGHGVIKINNRKFIAAHAQDFNYFDLDAYGDPYELLLNIFRKQKNKKFVVVLTDGLWRNLNYGRGGNLIRVIINNKSGISIPALNRHHDFIIALILKTLSRKFDINIEECKIIDDKNNKMRYLGLLCNS